MTIKKLKIIGIVFIFLISFITHNIYDMFPNFITSLFFPVNESIFEHMKMINISYIIWIIIELILIRKNNIKTLNFKSSSIVSLILNIVIFLIIYLPIYNLFGYNTIITISLYLLSIIIAQIISFKVLDSKKEYYFLNKYSYILILIITLSFIYLTYYPLDNYIFIDKVNKKLGLKNYY